MKKTNFDPLVFLASLGAGGIAVAPFVYFQYAKSHGKGLITFTELMAGNSSGFEMSINAILMGVMVLFSVVHFALTTKYLAQLFPWLKSVSYKKLMSDPLKNSAILAPFVSIAMSMNIVIGVMRFFIPAISTNFQSLMLPALLFWLVIWALLMKTEISLLKTSFSKEFDINKISFGWLLHPFALSMVSVTGMGIAAMAKNPDIAHTAALTSTISLSMGLFLFAVKLISVFTSHFNQKGVPERQFLPSFLIVVPIITLFAITFFRLGHYFEHQFGYHFDSLYAWIILLGFAFQTWYLMFGISMLKDYFKKDFFKKEYYVTLWAFICPFVAYSVLTSFLYKVFVPAFAIELIILASLFVAVTMYGYVFQRYAKFSAEEFKMQVAAQKAK